jgi:Tol biopolymer transport system component
MASKLSGGRLRRFGFALLVGALLVVQACGGGGGGGNGNSGGGNSAAPADSFLITDLSGNLQRFDVKDARQTAFLALKDASIIDPTIALDGSRISFVRAPTITTTTTDYGSDIYTANLDGSNPQPLIEHAVQSEFLRWPTWLPDGKSMVVQAQTPDASFAHIAKIDLASSTRTTVAENAVSPTISPDGSTLAYVTQDPASGEQAIWLAPTTGGPPQKILTSNADLAYFGYLSFSPDGSQLVFGAAQPKTTSLAAGGAGVAKVGLTTGAQVPDIRLLLTDGLPEDPWIVNRDGSNLHKLTGLGEDQPSFAWSSDGKWIYSWGGTGLWQINLQSGKKSKLAQGVVHGQIVRLPATP